LVSGVWVCFAFTDFVLCLFSLVSVSVLFNIKWMIVTTVNRTPKRMELKRNFLFVGCPDYYAFTRQMSNWNPLGGYWAQVKITEYNHRPSRIWKDLWLRVKYLDHPSANKILIMRCNCLAWNLLWLYLLLHYVCVYVCPFDWANLSGYNFIKIWFWIKCKFMFCLRHASTFWMPIHVSANGF